MNGQGCGEGLAKTFSSSHRAGRSVLHILFEMGWRSMFLRLFCLAALFGVAILAQVADRAPSKVTLFPPAPPK